MVLRIYDRRVVNGPEVDGDKEWREACGEGDLDQTRLGISIGRRRFVIEETLKKMANQERELAALWYTCRAKCCLDVHRKYLGLSVGEEALERISHERPA
jgi:hypothetical protein